MLLTELHRSTREHVRYIATEKMILNMSSLGYVRRDVHVAFVKFVVL